VIDDVVEGFEDPVRKPIFPHELPDVFLRVQFRAFGRQWDQRDIGRDDQSAREMPISLLRRSSPSWGSQLVLSAPLWQDDHSSGFYALQNDGLGEPQSKNLLGLIDAAQLKMSERLQASVTASGSLSEPR
jgi:hypothetical protein